MVPKILHYLWFGPYRESCNYVDAWGAIMPDYCVAKWDNTHPELKRYVDEAIKLFGGMETLQEKSMTYMSDMVRLLILRDWGGIYLDHDIIVVKDFTELLENKKCVLTFQYDPANFDKMHYKDTNMSTAELITFGGGYKYHQYSNRTVNNCFIACEQGSPIIQRAIDLTVENHFKAPEDQYVFSDWGVGPSVMTIIAKEVGLNPERSLTIENGSLTVYERSLLHPTHGSERHAMGITEYHNMIEKMIKDKIAYTIHYHEHFGVSMLMEKRLTLFPEWYKSFYETTT